MTFQGFEADRGACGTLKHSCPAAAFDRAGRKERCRAEPSREYGRIVRVDLEKHDRRIFTPTLGQPLLEARLQPPLRRGSTSTTPTASVTSAACSECACGSAS